MTLDEKIILTENQLKAIKDKYLRGDSPEQWLRRVAHNIALAELLYDKRIGKDKILEGVKHESRDGKLLLQNSYPESEERYKNFMKFISNLESLAKTDETATEIVSGHENTFYKMLSSFEFLPNSPTLMNAGRALQQLSGCYVLPVDDSIEGWANAISATMIIHKSGGGTGFSFSRVRPKDDVVKKTQKVASGSLSPMKMLDAVTEEVKQGGVRRGANMGVLRIDHPDIVDFITAKSKKDQLENFNISVAITNKFMDAYKNNSDYELINPRDNSITRKESARKIFDLIVKQAHKNGEPGLLFIDKINADNPTPNIGDIEATNPCGEQPLISYESCNLGSISLPKFVVDKKFDLDQLKQCVHSAVRFLDNVIDVNNYPLAKIESITKGNRKIGLGVMGWAETLIALGISYSSQEAKKEAEKVMKVINESALEASIKLAEERGAFPNASNSTYARHKHKPRNSTRTTIAPTGTIAVAAGLQGSGIEPLFALAYKRYMAAAVDAMKAGKTPEEKDVFYEKNMLFEEFAQENNWFGYSNENELWEDIVKNEGSIKGLEKVPRDIQGLFVTAHDIKPETHIEMQEAFQKSTNNAVSKTINFKKGTSIEEVAKAYLMAYEKNIKGITIYVDGSKEQQVLNLESIAQKSKLPADRPKIMIGITRREKFGKRPDADRPNKLYVTKTYYLPQERVDEIIDILQNEGIAFELFGHSAAFSPDDTARMTAHGKNISKRLQKGESEDDVAGTFLGLLGGTIAWEDGYVNLSLEDALAKALLDYPRKNKKEVKGISACPNCDSVDYIIKRESGCEMYSCCSFSKKCGDS